MVAATALSPQQEQLLLLEREKELRRGNKILYFKPQKWQREFISKTNEHDEVWVSKPNRVGGTFLGAALGTHWSTGEYPDGYDGRRFEGTTRGLIVGPKFDTLKIAAQKILFGERITKECIGTGPLEKDYPMMPRDKIADLRMNQDEPGCLDHAFIKHVSGDLSVIYLRSQKQDPDVVMGDYYHWVWFDEFPERDKFYSQTITRTWSSKGFIFITATPEHGIKKMPIVKRFREECPTFDGKPITWSREVSLYEAEHFTTKEVDKFKAQCPKAEVPFRIYGKPVFGQGLLLSASDEQIKADISEMPNPRNCRHIVGMDWGRYDKGALDWLMAEFGSNRWYLWDRQTLLDLEPFKVAQIILSKYREIGFNPPVSWGRDVANREATSGESLYRQFREYGVNMLNRPAHNAFMNDNENRILPGVYNLDAAMKEGNFKVVDRPHMKPFFDQKNAYCIDENGDIPKKKNFRFDDIDGVRYAFIMRKYAKFDDESDYAVSPKKCKMDWSRPSKSAPKQNNRERTAPYFGFSRIRNN